MKKTKGLLLISNSKNEADIRYWIGVQPPEEMIFLKTVQKTYVLVAVMEYNRLRRTVGENVTVLNPDQLGISAGKGISRWILKLLKETNISAIEVSPGFPLDLAEFLRRKKVKISVVKLPVCPDREIKNEQEIKFIRQSQRAAAAAMKAAIKQIASSRILENGKLCFEGKTLTSRCVRTTICRTLLDFDCLAAETIVCCGRRSADPHERGSGSLFAGKPIVIDIFPRSATTGYWGDMTRTVCRGPAPDALKKQYAAVKEAQSVQLSMLKEGVRADEVHHAGAQRMESRGFKTSTRRGRPRGFIHGTGHGVGLEIHEAPRIASNCTQQLRAGQVVTVEPGLYYPDRGGVRIEDTVLITEDGYRILAACPKKLEI